MTRITRRKVIGGAACTIAAVAITTPTTMQAATAPSATIEPESKGLFDDVLSVVTRASGISRDDIFSKSRERGIVAARQRCMYIFRLLSCRSYPEIGRRLGGRDHTTVIHALKKIETLRDIDIAIDRELDDLIGACLAEAARNGHPIHPDYREARADIRRLGPSSLFVQGPPSPWM